MDKIFCPHCGGTNTPPSPTPNGGDLYVAEDTGGSTEFYDEATPYECGDCQTGFYIGHTTN